MSLRFLVDLNLSMEWTGLLEKAGWSAVHWSDIGDPRADDATIMAWASANSHVVFTHDLDFGAALALTHANGPSVIQMRGHQVLPEQMGTMIVAAIRQCESELASGALVIVERTKRRVRVLPL
jgi:predicted nuclease of predicted toxin-antitoxin system